VPFEFQLYGERLALDDPALLRMLEMNRSILAILAPSSPGSELDVMPWLRHTCLSRRGMQLVEKAERLRDEALEVKLQQAMVIHGSIAMRCS